MTRRGIAAIALAVAGLALSGCGSSAPATIPAPAPSSAAAATGQEAVFLSQLSAIDPALAAKPDRALRRAENVCQEIAAGKEDQTLISNAQARFTGGSATVNEDQARQIVEAARSTIC